MNTHSLAWSLAAYRTFTTAVSVSVFTVGEHSGVNPQRRRITPDTAFKNTIANKLRGEKESGRFFF